MADPTHPKTILVTGGAGFIGSHLCRRLHAEGNRVISLDNYFAGTRDNHVPGVDYREGHTKNIAEYIPEAIQIIYHLGEYSRVEQSVLEPAIVHDLNTVGTAAVVKFWLERKCKLVYAGSSTKFGDAGATRHTSPYASSKAENSELVKEIGDQYKLPYAITYFYNVYGPGERVGVYGTVIESFKQMYMRGAPLPVVAPGTQQRNFTHVDDIVGGLVLVGDQGEGDEFGLGNEHAFSIMDIARLFGSRIMMLPERTGNRLQAGLDTTKARELGWKAKRSIEAYIREFTKANPPGNELEQRILVFSTTFHPIRGPAEDTLVELARSLPDIQLDIITTRFAKSAFVSSSPLPNISIHRVGWGTRADKFLLMVLGFLKARKLHREHRYLFAWALMASYAAFAGMLFRRTSGKPLLITLADQDLSRLSAFKRCVIRSLLTDADQIYGNDAMQEQDAKELSGRSSLRRSLGDGDAFVNPIRFLYSSYLRERIRDV